MSETTTQRSEMISASRLEARVKLEAVIGPLHPGENLKSVWPRVASALGFKRSRVQKIWAKEARRIDAFEMDRLRAAAARAEHLRTAAQMDGAANALVAIDTDFHGPEIDRLRQLARQLRALSHSPGEGA